MRTTYEVRSGRRTISLQRADSAREAIIEYLRSMGCRDEEMSTAGANAIIWQGAVYRAEPVESS
jgi:predicted deacylase